MSHPIPFQSPYPNDYHSFYCVYTLDILGARECPEKQI